MDEFWLTDDQFEKIAPHLPANTRGKPRVDDRRVISGIIHVLTYPHASCRLDKQSHLCELSPMS